MKRGKRFLLGLLGTILLIGICYVVSTFLFLDDIIDYWWFNSLGYGIYYILRISYRYLLFGITTAVFWFLFYINLKIVLRYTVPVTRPKSEEETRTLHFFAKLIGFFKAISQKVYALSSLGLALIVTLPIFNNWETVLFSIFGVKSHIFDPSYHIDISFYLFLYPVLQLVYHRILIAFLALFALCFGLYWFEHKKRSPGTSFSKGVKFHLNLLALILILLHCGTYLLQLVDLLYNESQMPKFFGPDFIQMNVILPEILACLGLWCIAGLMVLFCINVRKGFIPAAVLVLLFITALGLRNSDYPPDLAKKFFTRSNPTSNYLYAQRNIDATLAAYNLSGIETRQFTLQPRHWADVAEDVQANLENIPVWDEDQLDAVYDKQGFKYYTFKSIDVDRYTINGHYQQVNLAAREFDLDKIKKANEDFATLHLKYALGHGVVMTAATQTQSDPIKWLIRDIPPRSRHDLTISKPEIYYGLEDYTYVIVPNKVGELLPDGEGAAKPHYKGKMGIPIASHYRKLLFAYYFKNLDIFSTKETIPESKLLFRRNFREALKIMTPFFKLDKDPYPVVTSHGIYWIQDAYTTSKWFPNAAYYDSRTNYIRNSVKIVISAYDGTIDFYIADPKDPIVTAYHRMYPGLLKPLRQMPAEMKSHIRYPKDFFKIQLEIYRKYHETNLEHYLSNTNEWDFAHTPGKRGTTSGKSQMRPYYMTLNLINTDKHEFMLLAPMRAAASQNLRALVVAGCDAENYGKLFVYRFPKGTVVSTPSQVSAYINQDTTIAEQFTLWDQAGSEVKPGRMIILPIKHELFYIQPVFMAATAETTIPQLKRLIVSNGEQVAMDVSLEKAFATLEQKIDTFASEDEPDTPPQNDKEDDGGVQQQDANVQTDSEAEEQIEQEDAATPESEIKSVPGTERLNEPDTETEPESAPEKESDPKLLEQNTSTNNAENSVRL